MVFGLFGGNAEETALRSSLTSEAFMEEFEKTQKAFGIVSTNANGKDDIYGKVEATGQFVFEQVMKIAVGAGTISSKKDIQGATMLCVVLVQCLGRHAGLSKTQLQFALGKVPGHVYSLTLDENLKSMLGDSITKAIIGYTHKIRQKRFRHNVEAAEENLTRFLSERKPEYYSNLAGDIARFS